MNIMIMMTGKNTVSEALRRGNLVTAKFTLSLLTDKESYQEETLLHWLLMSLTFRTELCLTTLKKWNLMREKRESKVHEKGYLNALLQNRFLYCRAYAYIVHHIGYKKRRLLVSYYVKRSKLNNVEEDRSS